MARACQDEAITKSLAYFIAKDMMPFRTVERPGFKTLMNTVAPKYKIPRRQQLSEKEIPNMYLKVKADVVSSLAEAQHVAFTTDLWTSNTGHPYMSLTAHFITPAWEMKAACLETAFLPEDHTAENIKQAFNNLIAEWGIDQTAEVCVMTDNATNMKAAFKSLPSNWISCFGHNLNLALGKALKINQLEAAVKACRSVVQGFNHSWKRRRELAKKQAELNLPQHTLIQDVVTRWGSTYDMMSRFVEQHTAVAATLMGDRNTRHLVLKGSYISTLEDACKVLKPLRTFTDSLAAETRITISSLRPVLHLMASILAEEDDDSSLMKSMKCVIRQNLEERYEDPDMAKVMNNACVLDPRFKLTFTEEEANVIPAIKSQLEQQVATSEGSSCSLSHQESSARGESEEENTEVCSSEPSEGLAGILKMISKKTQQRKGQSAETERQTAVLEVSAYTSMPTIPVEKDPLQWWKANEDEFPRLAKLARKVLCVPATSVSSERLFSSSGNIQTVFRSSLTPDKLNMLVFLHKNLP
ncbi:E3 SUMO-protein ligase ZBED1-like [Cheilinus undulatus]|uniref:E3 SUMO-protein ligase ZBED1-like n=1 Tax=Cheilinus undulatus TaxID=241271 RepID=UPI001BD4F48F|nr:E3 SUMO-protein ligase ZBED1-like [Cheilinus undulatus]